MITEVVIIAFEHMQSGNTQVHISCYRYTAKRNGARFVRSYALPAKQTLTI